MKTRRSFSIQFDAEQLRLMKLTHELDAKRILTDTIDCFIDNVAYQIAKQLAKEFGELPGKGLREITPGVHTLTVEFNINPEETT